MAFVIDTSGEMTFTMTVQSEKSSAANAIAPISPIIIKDWW